MGESDLLLGPHESDIGGVGAIGPPLPPMVHYAPIPLPCRRNPRKGGGRSRHRAAWSARHCPFSATLFRLVSRERSSAIMGTVLIPRLLS
jgi:hypothetical protein